jgi:hypothetical protein
MKFIDNSKGNELIANPKPGIGIESGVQSVWFLSFNDTGLTILVDVAFLKEYPGVSRVENQRLDL